MEFKTHSGGGIPLYVNARIAGWVCTTMNGQWCYVIAHHRCDSSPRFNSEHAAKMALLKIFGE